jgi:hypothetical protein
MKKIKINSVLSNFENETTNIESLADFDEKENTITYTEEELKVKITILKNKVIMSRKSEDYDLNLEFVQNQKIKCKYEVKSIGLNMDIDVFTKELNIEENIIYVNYQLFNEGKSIGTFEYKLMFRE